MHYKIVYILFIIIPSFSILSGCANTYDFHYSVDKDNAIDDFSGAAVYHYPNENIIIHIKSDSYSLKKRKLITEKDLKSNELVSTKYDGVKKLSFIEGRMPDAIYEVDIILFNMALNFLNLPIETIVLVPLEDKDYLYQVEFNKEKLPSTLYLPLSKTNRMKTIDQLNVILHELNHLSDAYHVDFGITPKPIMFIQEINSSRLGMCYLYLSQNYFYNKNSKKNIQIGMEHDIFNIDFDYKQTNEYMKQMNKIPDIKLQSILATGLVIQNINNFHEEYCLYFAPKHYQGLNINDWYNSQFIKEAVIK